MFFRDLFERHTHRNGDRDRQPHTYTVRVGMTEGEREREKERISMYWFIPTQMVTMDKGKPEQSPVTKTPFISPTLSSPYNMGNRGPRAQELGHLLLSSRCISKKLNEKWNNQVSSLFSSMEYQHYKLQLIHCTRWFDICVIFSIITQLAVNYVES